MILSVNELKKYITTEESDDVLTAKLAAIEMKIRKYTNNNFQDRRYRTSGYVDGTTLTVNDASYFKIGDTIMIDEDLCNITAISGDVITIDEDLLLDDDCIVTKIVYPVDVKMGAVDMFKWDVENRNKIGVQSETISRHSVTYFDMSGENSIEGYPKALWGFVKPYKKARF